MHGGSFSFILLVKLLNSKSAGACFPPNLFIRGCSSQLRVWVCVSVRCYWRASAWGPRFLLLCGRRGFSINRQLSLFLYNSKCLPCRCWTWWFTRLCSSLVILVAPKVWGWGLVWSVCSDHGCWTQVPCCQPGRGLFETQRQCWSNLLFPEKNTGRVFQTEGRRKEAADLIPTLNGCLFGWAQMNLQEHTYSNALPVWMIGQGTTFLFVFFMEPLIFSTFSLISMDTNVKFGTRKRISWIFFYIRS